MPLYGRKTRGRYRTRLGTTVDRKGQRIDKSLSGHYQYSNYWIGHSVSHSSPARMEYGLDFPFRKWLGQRINTQSSPLRYLDWGCWDGRAVEEVSHQFGSRVRVFGFDIQSFKSWPDSNVQYIHRDPWRFLRYFKDGTLDLITGHYSIGHFLNENGKSRASEYVTNLSKKLRPGGLLVFNTQHTGGGTAREWLEAVQDALPLFRIRVQKIEYREDWLTQPRFFPDDYQSYHHYRFTVERPPFSRLPVQPRQKHTFPEMDSVRTPVVSNSFRNRAKAKGHALPAKEERYR